MSLAAHNGVDTVLFHGSLNDDDAVIVYSILPFVRRKSTSTQWRFLVGDLDLYGFFMRTVAGAVAGQEL